MGYARSLFRDFECFHRILVGLDEDDIRLSLKQYKEKFTTYRLSSGIYTIKDIAKAVYTKRYHERTLQVEFDDDTMKTKLVSTRFSSTFGTLRFDERSSSYFIGFHTILGLKTY